MLHDEEDIIGTKDAMDMIQAWDVSVVTSRTISAPSSSCALAFHFHINRCSSTLAR